ncbi:hypothetical protein P280DRAFT_475044 [Massarina eburnea CBS 473.64]|uniref:Altered inheritance of mitochondria protein 6 n=1 Tax=Massarina eburnea CBS 473.64 TaxID=1395130 RepID=A0A6A6SE95_9PLEO|nr:hypothetical protein P280DRAFT_475044 [Massarina eburnea CBS 473.64]
MPSRMASVDAGSTLKPLLQDFEAEDPVAFPPSLKNRSFVSLSALEHGEEERGLRPRYSFLGSLLMAVRRRQNGTSREEEVLRSGKAEIGEKRKTDWDWRQKQFWIKVILGIPLSVVFFFGIVHIVNVSLSYIHVLRDDTLPYGLNRRPLDQFQDGKEVELDGLTRDVTPVHCHSHNDYWRRVPLYDAIQWGCTGVEADVWLFDKELFIGHNTNALTRERTFRSMYVDPLMRILDHQNAVNKNFTTSTEATKNGVFEVDPTQTLVLLVDFKNDGHEIYPFVSEQLAAFRNKGYLTYFNGNTTVPGPITVVATGNAPFDLVIANSTYRDIFFDAPLEIMYEDPSSAPAPKRDGQGTVGIDENSHFDLTNSYYASVSFGKSIGWLWFGRISDAQMTRIRGQIRGAKQRGLMARYWGTPDWPVSLRNKVWEVLVEEGVDYLNGDDLGAMTRLDWGVKRHLGWLG